MIEAEIRSAQHEVLLEQEILERDLTTSTEIITHLRDVVALLEAVKLVLSGDPVEIARQLRARAEQTIRPPGGTP